MESPGRLCACAGACVPCFCLTADCCFLWVNMTKKTLSRGRTGTGSDGLLATSCAGPSHPPLFPPHHSHVLRPRGARSQPLFTPKQRYCLRYYLSGPWLLPGFLFYQTYSTSNRIFISGGAEALELSAGCRHLYSLRSAINKPILYGLVASVESAATADMLLCSPPRCSRTCIIRATCK